MALIRLSLYVRGPIISIAACFENTTVAIPASSVAIYASDLDAGSYDNCELEKVEIKRSRTTSQLEYFYYKDPVTFYCADIGNVVELLLKATDHCGNTNLCSATIKVVDKIPPPLSIPPNLVVDCKVGINKKDDNGPYGQVFGTPSIYNNQALAIPSSYILSASGSLLTGQVFDNCPDDIVLSVETESKTNDCGIRTITRRFTAIDTYGNKSVSKEQTIEVKGEFTLDTNLTAWPKLDTTIIECTSNRDINPNIIRRPYIREATCTLYFLSYEDTYYELIGDKNGACSKISRRWIVINWCDIYQYVCFEDSNYKISRR
jgi:hypothetical protein